MPQMAPYNWLMLFFMFNLIMTIIIIYNYYNYTPMSSLNYEKNLVNKFNNQW